MKNKLFWISNYFAVGLLIFTMSFAIGCSGSGNDRDPFANNEYSDGSNHSNGINLSGVLASWGLLSGCISGGCDAATASFRMTWAANTEADLAGYNVYYGTSPRTNADPNNCPSDGNKCGYAVKLNVGNVTTHEFNLSPGKYYFAVTAVDTSGNESAFSSEYEKTK